MNLHTLELFCAVAEHQSISKAAKQLHISQPAVSAQVQSLEQFYDIQLFFRTTKGVKLTPAGQLVYDTAKRMVKLHYQTLEELKHCSKIGDQIHLGVTEPIGNYILPGILNKFRHYHPNIHIYLSILKNEEIIQGVSKKTIHLGIVEEEINPVINLESVKIGSDPIILAASPLLPITKKHQLTIMDVLQNLFILNPTDSFIRKKVEQWATQSNRANSMQLISEASSIQAIKTAVLTGYGVSFFPKSAIENELSLGLLVPLNTKKESDYPMEITYHLIYEAGSIPVSIQHFLSYLLQSNPFLAS